MAQPTFDDDQTAQAVDDIVAEESDEPLATETGKRSWWHYLGLALFGLFVLSCVIGAVPTSRYLVLNAAGVRASLSVKVLDKSTQQPLRGVMVATQGVEVQTGKDGKATLSHIKLGPTRLHIEHQAFSLVTQELTLGWGSNPLGDLQLTPTGAQYNFQLNDYLSAQPITQAQATSGSASAVADKAGRIVLTVDKPVSILDVTITSPGYRTERLTIDADSKGVRPIRLAPARWHTFVSKRAGTFDLYKIYADGQGEEMVLKGTGSETEDITLAPHPSNNVVAIVSSRGNRRNANDLLLSTLTLVDLATNKAEEIATADHIQVIGWVKDRLVYVRVGAGTGDNNPQHHRLASYDYQTKGAEELAASNSFNDVLLAAGKIYYAPSGKDAGFFRIDADGNNRQLILPTETWGFFRTNYYHLIIAGNDGNDWHDYDIAAGTTAKLNAAPTGLTSHQYIDSPDAQRALWIDDKNTLLLHDIKSSHDQALNNLSGLDYPLEWLSDTTIVYRINGQETADYVLSTNGGTAKKIQDVANTNSVTNWQHY